MLQYKSVILVLFFTSTFFCCTAQQSNKYVYQDSTVKTDSVAVSTEVQPDTATTTSNTTPVIPDTVLIQNGQAISPDSIAALKSNASFAYAKNLDSLLRVAKEENAKNPDKEDSGWLEKLLASPVTRIILWTLIGAFILFLLFKLFFAEGSFLKGRAIRSTANELAEADTQTVITDYTSLIAQAIANKNYRLATRYLYLQTLQNLADNNLIKLEAEKTNYQYINELSNTTYRESFMSLTLNYEYVWYGEFSLAEESFTTLKNKFEQFNSRLKK